MVERHALRSSEQDTGFTTTSLGGDILHSLRNVPTGERTILLQSGTFTSDSFVLAQDLGQKPGDKDPRYPQQDEGEVRAFRTDPRLVPIQEALAGNNEAEAKRQAELLVNTTRKVSGDKSMAFANILADIGHVFMIHKSTILLRATISRPLMWPSSQLAGKVTPVHRLRDYM